MGILEVVKVVEVVKVFEVVEVVDVAVVAEVSCCIVFLLIFIPRLPQLWSCLDRRPIICGLSCFSIAGLFNLKS